MLCVHEKKLSYGVQELEESYKAKGVAKDAIVRSTDDTVADTLSLYAKGYDVEYIARVRAVTTSTVYRHLLHEFAEDPVVRFEDIVTYRNRDTAYRMFTWMGIDLPLKEVKQASEEEVTYIELQFIRKYVTVHLLHFEYPWVLHPERDPADLQMVCYK